jgi:hypothetical protein
MDESQPREDNVLKVSRPFMLTLLCVFSLVFYGLISLLFLVAAFYPGSIARAINIYIPEGTVSSQRVIMIAIAGFCLHAFAMAGTVMILKMMKKGYIVFGIASLIISVYQLFQDKISFLTTLVYIVCIILFGLFYKKLK